MIFAQKCTFSANIHFFCLFLLEMENIMQKHSPKFFPAIPAISGYDVRVGKEDIFLYFFGNFFSSACKIGRNRNRPKMFVYQIRHNTCLSPKNFFHPHTPNSSYDVRVCWGGSGPPFFLSPFRKVLV